MVICYESFLTETMRVLHSQRADLVLIPMSAPTPTLNKPLRKQDLAEYNAAIGGLADNVAGELGVPAVMANKCGPWATASPWPLPREDSVFPGLSTIAAADGTVLARLGSEEGVLVADVELDPAREATSWSPVSAKWARNHPACSVFS